jgi:hypothetical protein
MGVPIMYTLNNHNNNMYGIEKPEILSTIYGVSFDGTSHIGTRLNDAEGKNWTPSNTTESGADDFKNISPFKFRRVLLKPNETGGKPTIDSYFDELNLTIEQYNQKAIDDGLDRFIEYDLYYYSRPDQWTWLISKDPVDGFLPCPACVRGNKVLSKWYVSEFMPNDEYRILENQLPIINATNSDYRTNLRAKGYRLSDYANYNSILMLALVKYADLNFQYCLGNGWSSGKVRQLSSGDNILGDDGYNGSTKDDNASIKVMGITDFYGNTWKNNDGIFATSKYLYINTDLDNITEWPTIDTWESMGFKKANIELPNSLNSYILEISYDADFPWMTHPAVIGGTKDDPIGDTSFANASTKLCCITLGGSAWVGTANGPFCWVSGNALTTSGTGLSCLATAFPE